MPLCEKCEREYDLDDGCEDDGLCHPCAHAMIAEAREWLESYSRETRQRGVIIAITRTSSARLVARRRREMILCSEKGCHNEAEVRIKNHTTVKEFPIGKAVCGEHVGDRAHVVKTLEREC